MKMKFLLIIISLLCCSHSLFAQDSTLTISANVVTTQNSVYISDTTGWVYQSGNNPAYALPGYNTTGWKSLRPSNITKSIADKDGNIEGWFRIRVKPDSSFVRNSLNLVLFYISGSEELYIDGKLIGSYGVINSQKKSFQKKTNIIPLVPGFMEIGKTHLIAVHYKNKLPSFPENLLPVIEGSLNLYIGLEGPQIYTTDDNSSFYGILWVTVCTVFALLFWLLAFQNRQEKNLSLIASIASFFSISAFTYYASVVATPTFIGFALLSAITFASNSLITILMIVIVTKILTNKIPHFARICIIVLIILEIYTIYGRYYTGIVWNVSNVAGLIIVFYYVINCWRKIRGAQWAIVIGIICAASFGTTYFISVLHFNRIGSLPILSVAFLSLPISLLIYVSLRFKEIINEVRDKATELLQVTEEKRQQALNQQKVLQEEVKKQTADIRATLINLKSTQAQLIQSEKMASLGELTAGIAHEIQNPLNFVNNFSEVSRELLSEMKTALNDGNTDEAKEIADDVIQNLEKIDHHGKRADAIVKGMLQHSRLSTGANELTDINALADEYLRLSYHGLRAKDKNFKAELKTDFDESIGKINIIAQDIGRVLLNLFNNAFYAVNEKAKLLAGSYQPIASVTTKKLENHVVITVSDNGNGIPQNIIDKIFQPFFTTKPTGKGTGLGLSLSYDIVKAHGGEIKVESKEGEGTAFIIILPLKESL